MQSFIIWSQKTRGAEDSKEKVRRFQTEIEYMRCHWMDILKTEILIIIKTCPLLNGITL